ncbi:ASCH domain-containing protein [Rothia sp. AR01]|uniref:ASCH domain-containing protein n=1 Tax=Rothia santali TaxID=2949643 RepID=A0A9X2HDG7_9MICC|nr:ASCH domain-containing protein [Rothia santali]MCP3425164.1 ASCH domain-containing protein [Rothia santali]
MQQIMFHPSYYGPILRHQKQTTVRWNEKIHPGSATFHFGDDENYPPMRGWVESVESYPAARLTAEQAHALPGTDMAVFVEDLRTNFYPSMPDDAVLTVVVFKITAPDPW